MKVILAVAVLCEWSPLDRPFMEQKNRRVEGNCQEVGLLVGETKTIQTIM